MKRLTLILLISYLYKLLAEPQFTKPMLRGMKDELDLRLIQSYSISLPEREYRNIYNNVLAKATAGETELHFRILCNPNLCSKEQYVDNILSSILFEDGSSRSSDEIIPKHIYVELESNKKLTEKVLNKLKESFPDSNIITSQLRHSKCQKYTLSW